MVNGAAEPVGDAPAGVKPHLDALLSRGELTVRDGILVLLALAVEHGTVIDWREQTLHNPAREASKDLGRLYRRLEIPGPSQALTSGATRYIDRPNAGWKAVLEWASTPALDTDDLTQRIADHFETTVQAMVDATAQSSAVQQARFAARLAGLDLPPVPGPAQLATAGAPIHSVVRNLVAASQRAYGVRHIEEAFLYLAARVAETARSTPSMPDPDRRKLTFAATFALLDELLDHPSNGAHEQFFFAALLAAWREEVGPPDLVIETKRLHTSDRAAKTAADVQEKVRGQIIEAYEVTADSWRSKVDKAVAILREQDELRRIHIVAGDTTKASGDQFLAGIPAHVDVTVLGLREEVRSLVARMQRTSRADALVRIYEHLAVRQPDPRLVGRFVAALQRRGLVD